MLNHSAYNCLQRDSMLLPLQSTNDYNLEKGDAEQIMQMNAYAIESEPIVVLDRYQNGPQSMLTNEWLPQSFQLDSTDAFAYEDRYTYAFNQTTLPSIPNMDYTGSTALNSEFMCTLPAQSPVTQWTASSYYLLDSREYPMSNTELDPVESMACDSQSTLRCTPNLPMHQEERNSIDQSGHSEIHYQETGTCSLASLESQSTIAHHNYKTCQSSTPDDSKEPTWYAEKSESNISASATLANFHHRGSLQLWQFLVALLDDPKSQHLVCWTGRQLEFKLNDPEEVARLWGVQKNRPAMNYDKLSRSLRYYYEKGIMQKVSGERYVYRFIYEPQILFSLAFPNEDQQSNSMETCRRINQTAHVDEKDRFQLNSINSDAYGSVACTGTEKLGDHCFWPPADDVTNNHVSTSVNMEECCGGQQERKGSETCINISENGQRIMDSTDGSHSQSYHPQQHEYQTGSEFQHPRNSEWNPESFASSKSLFPALSVATLEYTKSDTPECVVSHDRFRNCSLNTPPPQDYQSPYEPDLLAGVVEWSDTTQNPSFSDFQQKVYLETAYRYNSTWI